MQAYQTASRFSSEENRKQADSTNVKPDRKAPKTSVKTEVKESKPSVKQAQSISLEDHLLAAAGEDNFSRIFKLLSISSRSSEIGEIFFDKLFKIEETIISDETSKIFKVLICLNIAKNLDKNNYRHVKKCADYFAKAIKRYNEEKERFEFFPDEKLSKAKKIFMEEEILEEAVRKAAELCQQNISHKKISEILKTVIRKLLNPAEQDETAELPDSESAPENLAESEPEKTPVLLKHSQNFAPPPNVRFFTPPPPPKPNRASVVQQQPQRQPQHVVAGGATADVRRTTQFSHSASKSVFHQVRERKPAIWTLKQRAEVKTSSVSANVQSQQQVTDRPAASQNPAAARVTSAPRSESQLVQQPLNNDNTDEFFKRFNGEHLGCKI